MTAAPAGPGPLRRRAVALLSGGLDSGTAVACWLAEGHEVALCLCVDYGQRAWRQEAAASRRLAERFGLEWRAIELPWLAEAAREACSALVVGTARELPDRDAEAPGDTASAAAVWVPARNVALLGVAAAFADARGCDAVLTGFNREEAETFPDNSPAFVAAGDEVLRLGTRDGRVRVAAPNLHLDKPEIVAAARACGLCRDDFWSCYRADSDPLTCRCESCVRSRRAWTA